MKMLRIISLFIILACLFPINAQAGNEKEETVIAVLYTRANYQGLSWKITQTGEYDLGEGFQLPNDSIVSLQVMPGYELTLYEHVEFEGGVRTWRANDPELDTAWRRQASSLTIEREQPDPELVRAWLKEVDAAQRSELDASALYGNPKKVAGALAFHASTFSAAQKDKVHWYADMDDAQRVAAADPLLKLFSELGYDMSDWSPNTFAQQINNYMDDNDNRTIWETACLIVGAKAAWYVEFYETAMKKK